MMACKLEQQRQPEQPDRRSNSSYRRSNGVWVRVALALVMLASFTYSWKDILVPRSSIDARVARIFKKVPLIDGHNDIAIAIRESRANKIYNDDFDSKFQHGNLSGQTDIPRIKAGHYGGAFWSAFWLCQDDIFDFSDAAYAPVVEATLGQLDLLKRFLHRYPEYFPSAPTDNPDDALRAFRKGKLVSPFIIEGLHQIGNRFSNLRLYYELGVRYATLNWNCHNVYSDAAVLTFNSNRSSVISTPYWGGISERGRELIYEMNRLGMIVDLAHTSPDTMRDVLAGQHNHDAEHGRIDSEWKGSLAPPIFSHSSAKAICPHPRNVPDDVLQLVKQRGSVVMINFLPDFISCELPPDGAPPGSLPVLVEANNTLAQVVRHIRHIGELIGYDHVGLGTDYDGMPSVPRGLEDVSKFPDLVAELLRQGVSDADCVKIIGGNILRVWREVVKVSHRLQSQGTLPAEDDLPKLD